ncbi:MAG: alcohol dehydrogenase catalytic domain-containing protein [Anaerolineae bacterium]|nr:alcohol dehydrogenase catalytic domain-containing protein [Anaerolineae bacterium]MCB9103559.1 alcohol dehydrogenase catalytic domain-containing protein [Anaerolineales bacterium]
MQTMHVPVFKGQGRLEYEERPVPRLDQSTDVIVQVEACGICGTDLNILAVPPAHQARPNIIIGHEGVGQVVEVGEDVSDFKPGDRVVIAPRLTCGECVYCRRGLDNQCINYQTIGTTIDGAFAPYLRAPQQALYKIDAAVSRDDAALFEPLSCVVGSVARAPMQPGDAVAIIGAGPMGLLFAETYRIMGAGPVIVIDIAANRLEFARQLGVDVTLNAAETDPAGAVLDITNIGADIVVDAVGNQLPAALKLVRRGGHVLLFGLRPHDQQTINQYQITRYDINLHGAFVGLKPFVQTVQLLEGGRLQPSRLITHHVPLTELPRGVELMRSGQSMKVIVETRG